MTFLDCMYLFPLLLSFFVFHFGNLPFSLSPEALDLASKLLSLDPKKRISSFEALRHPWFWTAPLPCSPQYVSLHFFLYFFLVVEWKLIFLSDAYHQIGICQPDHIQESIKVISPEVDNYVPTWSPQLKRELQLLQQEVKFLFKFKILLSYLLFCLILLLFILI